ncbi:GNAT family N-acetyltransferase [Nonomuraea sp. LPB2021202275-12-8]|uniref:GNAT family N-acetyltransferase n=1 Tax=Nonomuraea sp. LPB2021202275-12-8 TaxID=3120159 RepID=UPI00300BFBE8
MTTIRQISDADLPAVAAIYAHYVTDSVVTFDETPPSPEDWRAKADAIAAAGLPFIVAESGGQVLGYAYAAQYRPKPAYRHTLEDSIYLAPEATGRGLGRLLLGELIAAVSRTEARQIVAVIADGGEETSRKLHAAFGFAEAGRLRNVGFKHGRWIDTVLLQLDLRR